MTLDKLSDFSGPQFLYKMRKLKEIISKVLYGDKILESMILPLNICQGAQGGDTTTD